MTTPDNPFFRERLITIDTMTRLQDAVRNLFALGPHANRERYRVFNDVVIDDGKLARSTLVGLRDKPTHIYSGTLHPYGSTMSEYHIWKRFEGSAPSKGIIDGETIDPTMIVREHNVPLGRKRGYRSDYVIDMSGRAFELLSTDSPTFMRMRRSDEMNDRTANGVAELFEYLVDIATQRQAG